MEIVVAATDRFETRAYRHHHYFFFQAEDGIRDVAVTGVQTCALPISFFSMSTASSRPLRRALGRSICVTSPVITARSEERRVGKECRSRGRPGPEKKKQQNGYGNETVSKRSTVASSAHLLRTTKYLCE